MGQVLRDARRKLGIDERHAGRLHLGQRPLGRRAPGRRRRHRRLLRQCRSAAGLQDDDLGGRRCACRASCAGPATCPRARLSTRCSRRWTCCPPSPIWPAPIAGRSHHRRPRRLAGHCRRAAAPRIPRQTLFYYCYNHLQAVRHGKWKLVLPRPAKPPWCSWSARMVDAGRRAASSTTWRPTWRDADVAGRASGGGRRTDGTGRRGPGNWATTTGSATGPGSSTKGRGARTRTLGWQRIHGPAAAGRRRRAVSAGLHATNGDRPGTGRHSPRPERRDPQSATRTTSGTRRSPRARTSGAIPAATRPTSAMPLRPTERRGPSRGLAVGKGGAGEWDEHGVFTPNILACRGQVLPVLHGRAPAVRRRHEDGHRRGRSRFARRAVDESRGQPGARAQRRPGGLRQHARRRRRAGRPRRQVLALLQGPPAGPHAGRDEDGRGHRRETGGPVRRSTAKPLHPGHEVLVWPHGRAWPRWPRPPVPDSLLRRRRNPFRARRNSLHGRPQAPGCFAATISANGTARRRHCVGHQPRRAGATCTWFVSTADSSRPAAAERPAQPEPVPYDNAPAGRRSAVRLRDRRPAGLEGRRGSSSTCW